jgi:hypothetical protein
MKHFILLTVFMLLLTTSNFSQDKMDVYGCSYSEKEYSIEVTNDKKLYVYMLSLDGIATNGGIFITSTQHQKFCHTLIKAKEKYDEWKKVAIENNVTELTKRMDFKCGVGGFFQYGKSWHFKHNVSLTYEFRIINGKYILLVNTGRIKSSSNQYIDSDGYVFAFMNSDEVDDFINKIRMVNIDNFLNNSTKKDVLFN